MATSDIRLPLLFAAAYTADFIHASIPDGANTLLDVGCGDGLVTRQLQLRGYSVNAIDGSVKGIERARQNGVDAIHSKLEDYDHAPFDCVYMSRALHHMPPLGQTLNKISALLSNSGTLVIEDFGFDLADESACSWLFGQTSKIIGEQAEPVCCEFRHDWLHEPIKSPAEAFCTLAKTLFRRTSAMVLDADARCFGEALRSEDAIAGALFVSLHMRFATCYRRWCGTSEGDFTE